MQPINLSDVLMLSCFYSHFVFAGEQGAINRPVPDLRLMQPRGQVNCAFCSKGTDCLSQKCSQPQECGALDILVSNAAVNPFAGALLDTPDDAIDKILDINVKSALILAREAVPHMRPGSSIVFVSSVTALNPAGPIAMYAVSKTALLGLTKGLAAELGPQGIRVNCLAPGIVPTKFSSALVESPELEKLQVPHSAHGLLIRFLVWSYDLLPAF